MAHHACQWGMLAFSHWPYRLWFFWFMAAVADHMAMGSDHMLAAICLADAGLMSVQTLSKLGVGAAIRQAPLLSHPMCRMQWCTLLAERQ